MNRRLATAPPIDRELDVAGKVRVQQMRTLFEGGPVRQEVLATRLIVRGSTATARG